ncbi:MULTISPECIES: TIGR03086 family metal-binding protein [Nocardia]|uniref:TIGR03086 family metal-binding protein n=1 Tax=Nocardia TaxID=1817 RepID=UPI000BF2145F|nr:MULTISPECIES: TIGR03086 family metal-binding protein [Nocardia]MBF6185901.1 TIGR03086 family protein [Nocardia farcinica]MBF6311746.1 TIGR03086 family protein [Nocardia farcinica]MBF6408730.1 TIGR03086 family protein [Nocardia farcinica]PEH79850.1 TIGR03086 family protein [Nocardia sp. FDAARGOS_372]UEX20925.1 TIGR03086 family metal-binding protein [Nocardia farcinica]
MTETPTRTVLDDLASTIATLADLVATIGPDHWQAATPCPAWTARDLVNHLVLGTRLCTAALTGTSESAAGTLDPALVDALGADPASAYRSAGEALLAAFGRPGAADRIVHMPFGAVPGTVAAHLRLTEELVHGWDLATTLGTRPPFTDAAAERALAFTRATLSEVPAGRSPFAPPRPAPATATPVEQLAALLGRPVR